MRSSLPDRRTDAQSNRRRRNGEGRGLPPVPQLDAREVPMSRAKIATVWLDGCSGCHMSFLDMDERLIALASLIDLVYSPLVDNKEFPADVDVTLVEGAVSTDEDEEKIRRIRGRTKILVALGDCAVTGIVPSLRNPFGTPA